MFPDRGEKKRRMTGDQENTSVARRHVLIYLVIAVVTMILLSAGISAVHLLPGRPFTFWRGLLSFPQQTPNVAAINVDMFIVLLRGLLALSIVLLPFSLIYVIVSPKARRMVLGQISMIMTILAFYYILVRLQEKAREGGLASLEQSLLALGDSESFSAVMAFVTNPPQWLVLVVILLLSLLLTMLVLSIAGLAMRHRQDEDTLIGVAKQAETALEALKSGADLKDVVIRCYVEMTRVLREQRGIQRPSAMTPREFEACLETLGLPKEPVHRLTRLFEDVRYGTHVTGPEESQLALLCLESIAAAARRPAP